MTENKLHHSSWRPVYSQNTTELGFPTVLELKLDWVELHHDKVQAFILLSHMGSTQQARL